MKLRSNPIGWWVSLPIVFALLLFGLVLHTRLNFQLFFNINHVAHMAGSGFWANMTLFGDGLVVAALCLPFIRRRPDVVGAVLLAAVIMTLTVHLMKDGFNVPRPPRILDHESFNIIGPAYKRHAFPSGHTATAFMLAGVWVFLRPGNRLRTALLLTAILVGISRISVGIHWPLDVLAGAVIGWGAALMGAWMAQKINWEQQPVTQIVFGLLLAGAAATLAFFYDTGYEQAALLQRLIGVACLLTGVYDIYRLIIESVAKPMQPNTP